MIACDHGANFVAGGMSAGCFFKTPRRRNDKLVRGKDQFGGKAFASMRNGLLKQTRTSLLFRSERFCRSQHIDDFPFFRGGDQRRGLVIAQIDMKKSRAPQVTLMGVTPALFGPINDLMNIRSGDCESRLAPVQLHAQRRETTAGRGDFVTTLDGGYLIRSRSSFVHRRFMMAKLKSRPQLQTRTLSAFQNAINDVDGVLQMGQENAFLQNDITHAIRPDRQAIFQTKLLQPIRAFQIKLTAGTFLAAQRTDIVIAEAEKLRNVVPHDHATERRGQRGDEQAMITPRDSA